MRQGRERRTKPEVRATTGQKNQRPLTYRGAKRDKQRQHNRDFFRAKASWIVLGVRKTPCGDAAQVAHERTTSRTQLKLPFEDVTTSSEDGTRAERDIFVIFEYLRNHPADRSEQLAATAVTGTSIPDVAVGLLSFTRKRKTRGNPGPTIAAATGRPRAFTGRQRTSRRTSSSRVHGSSESARLFRRISPKCFAIKL